MATSGSKTVKVTNWNNLVFSWSTSSQSTANNTSTVAWALKLTAGSDGYISSSASKDWSVTVNGTNYSGTNTVGISNNSTKTLASGTTIITHNADGTKTFSYSFSQEFNIQFDGTIGTISGSGSGTLNTIPRKSSLTASNGTLGVAQSVTISRASSTFKHRIQYKCGSTSGYVAGSASTYTTATSITWTPPLSLASQNTTGTAVSVQFVLGTYNANNELIGYTYKTISCAIPASVKPSCSLTLEDVNNIDDIYGSPVQGLSAIKITVNATTSYGSPIASYLITADGKTYTTQTATTAVLIKAGSSPITATVTDKRGRKGTASYTMSVQAYERPNVSKLTVHRCDSNGTENPSGSYIKATFSAAISGLNSKNTASYVLKYKKSSASTYTTQTVTALANKYTVTDHSVIFAAETGSSYDIQVVATDRHYSDTRTTSASTAFTLFHFGKDGKSLGIGKVVENPGWFENDLPLQNNKTLVQKGNRYTLSSPGTSGTSGYVLMAQITVTAANADTPITFVLSRRQENAPMTVHIRLKNASGVVATLESIKYEGANYDAYAYSADGTTWGLYVLKGSAYDTITIQDWYTSSTMNSRVSVTFPGTLVSTVPTPYYKATPAQLESLLDYIYPVGSVYISYSHNSPTTMFGGTWVRIENAFLWATTASGTIGQTGGESEVTLTTEQMPSHRHSISIANTATGSTTASNKIRYNNDNSSYVGTGYTEYSGSGQAHNNMPPYIQVSVWRRTA